MADPHSPKPVLTERDPWSERMLREVTASQTTLWRFRLFGPLTSDAVRPIERPETTSMAIVVANRTFA